MEDDDPVGYYIIINLPFCIYCGIYGFVCLKHGLPLLRMQKEAQVSGYDPEVSFVGKEKENIDVYKSSMKFKLCSLYFALWVLTNIGNWVYLFGEDGFIVYCVLQCVHPLVIMVVIYLSYKQNVHLFERGKEK